MISVDKELVFAARRMITGANVHSVNTLIFLYEQATAIKNVQMAKQRLTFLTKTPLSPNE